MKLFEFDISWDQAVNYSFDQDDVKTIGKRRVESDNVHVLAPDEQIARIALERAFSSRNLSIQNPVREIPIHLSVEYRSTVDTAVSVTRTTGPEELNRLGQRVKGAGAL